ncbi:MAG: hydroxymethylbilane synthase [Pseudomonadota bacterium]|jgi:hydroxymethylbilane synthase
MTRHLRIATRRSPLALWQAEHVAALLRAAHPHLDVSLVKIITQGDRIQDRPLSQVGGKGLFIKELEIAMLEGEAELAVHSMKDVPAALPAGFTLAAVLPRADARDAFLSRRYSGWSDLPIGARVGTSSLRRQSLLRAKRPDLNIFPLRGNVDTRLRKLDAGDFDAIILAAAGLTRLGLAERITEYLDITVSLPAIGQGIVGIECRDDPQMRALLAPLNDAPTRLCLDAERSVGARLEGGCTSPIAAYATLSGAVLSLRAFVGAPDGSASFEVQQEGSTDDPVGLGTAVAERLLSAGADQLLAALAASTA